MLQDIMSASSDVGDRGPTGGIPPPLVHDRAALLRRVACRMRVAARVVARCLPNRLPTPMSRYPTRTRSGETPPTVDTPSVVSAPNDGRPQVASPEEKRAVPSEPPSGGQETKTSDAPLGGSGDGFSSKRPGDSRPPRMTILDSTRLGRLFPELAVRPPSELLTEKAKQAAASRMGVPSCIGAPPDFAISNTSFVGIPAKLDDTADETVTLDGFGGLEVLVGVEGLTEEHIQEVKRRIAPKIEVYREVLFPHGGDSDWSAPGLQALVNSIGGQRELASLVRMYCLDNLARKTFGTVTLLSRTLDRLAAAEKQLTSSKMATSLQLLDVQDELREAKNGRAVLAEYYSKLFDHILERSRSEIAEHKRDFKRAAQAHERQEEASRLQIDELHREIDDLRDHN